MSKEKKIIKRIIKELTGVDTSNGTYYTEKELRRGLRMIRDQTIVDMVSDDIKRDVNENINRAFDEMMGFYPFDGDEEVRGLFPKVDIVEQDDDDVVEIYIGGEKVGVCGSVPEDYKMDWDKVDLTGIRCSECNSTNLQSRGSFVWCKDCGKVE